MGPLPGKFVTVPVALNFLSIALTVDMGIFRQVTIFYSHSLMMLSPHLICVFSYYSHIDV